MKRIHWPVILLLSLVVVVSAEGVERVSEGTSPATCGSKLLAGIGCSGSYCDEITLHCGRGSYEIEEIYWTGYVSEEGRTHTAACPAGSVITGLACNGRYCDNVAAECVRLVDHVPADDCSTTRWVSEEIDSLDFDGEVATSLTCNGSYCDNKRFRVCPLVRRDGRTGRPATGTRRLRSGRGTAPGGL